MEWRSDRKNLFTVISADLKYAGWTNLALVLEQMVEAKCKVFLPPKDYKYVEATTSVSIYTTEGTGDCYLGDMRWRRVVVFDVWGATFD